MPDLDIFQVIEMMRQSVDDPERTRIMTLAIVKLIGEMVYYMVVGLVIWGLGKRLIQATVFAWKESRRDVP